MIELDKYLELHTQPVVATDIVIDPQKFDSRMNEWRYGFRSWGEKKKHFPRFLYDNANYPAQVLSSKIWKYMLILSTPFCS